MGRGGSLVVLQESNIAHAVWLKLIVLTGKEWGGAARPLDLFFFLINFAYEQKLSKNIPQR